MDNNITRVTKNQEMVVKKLEMALALALFFPTLLTSLFSINNASDTLNLNNTILNWGFVISSFIIILILIELYKKIITEWWFGLINYLLLINICDFGIIIFLLAKYKNAIPNIFIYWLFKITLYLLYIPILIISTILIGTILCNFFKKITKHQKINL